MSTNTSCNYNSSCIGTQVFVVPYHQYHPSAAQLLPASSQTAASLLVEAIINLKKSPRTKTPEHISSRGRRATPSSYFLLFWLRSGAAKRPRLETPISPEYLVTSFRRCLTAVELTTHPVITSNKPYFTATETADATNAVQVSRQPPAKIRTSIFVHLFCSRGAVGPTEIGLFLGLGLPGPKQIGLFLGLGLSGPKQIGIFLGLGLPGPKQIGLLLPPWTRALVPAPGRTLVWTRTPGLLALGVWRAGSAASQPALGLGKSNLPHRTKGFKKGRWGCTKRAKNIQQPDFPCAPPPQY
jgi:hypothetical protein